MGRISHFYSGSAHFFYGVHDLSFYDPQGHHLIVLDIIHGPSLVALPWSYFLSISYNYSAIIMIDRSVETLHLANIVYINEFQATQHSVL